MALIACPECKTEVSSNAETCPKCGVRIKPKSRTGLKILGWIVGVPAGLFLLLMIKVSNEPQDEERLRAQRAIELCRKDLDDPLRTFSQKESIRWACGGLRDKYVAKYGREP